MRRGGGRGREGERSARGNSTTKVTYSGHALARNNLNAHNAPPPGTLSINWDGEALATDAAGCPWMAGGGGGGAVWLASCREIHTASHRSKRNYCRACRSQARIGSSSTVRRRCGYYFTKYPAARAIDTAVRKRAQPIRTIPCPPPSRNAHRGWILGLGDAMATERGEVEMRMKV